MQDRDNQPRRYDTRIPAELAAITKQAGSRIRRYVTQQGLRTSRPYQVPFLLDLADFFDQGKNAGYEAFTTGWGKTHFGAAIIEALRVPTVILSPTTDILDNTAQVVGADHRQLRIASYSGAKKEDLTAAEVINTTYQSIQRLVSTGQVDASKIGLLIVDEADLGLGDIHHKLYRQFPNAIKIGLTATPFFPQIDRYASRGLLDPGEPWIAMFTTRINGQSLTEGMEKGINPPLRAFQLRSGIRVARIGTDAKGEYKLGELDEYLNTEDLGFEILGLLAGPDKLQAVRGNARFSERLMEDIAAVYQEIKGRPTMVFANSIDHAISIQELLARYNLTAATFFSRGLSRQDRNDRLAAHRNGSLPILVGVDALGRGVDAPATEVGIISRSTRSAVRLGQMVGRLTRTSPETGKTHALAIQLVHEHAGGSDQRPLLVSDLFDPEYVKRGGATGREARRRHAITTGNILPPPVVTFEGAEVDGIIQEAHQADLARARFNEGSVKNLSETIDQELSEIASQLGPQASLLDLYQKWAGILPGHISSTIGKNALQAIADIDTNLVKYGRKVLTFMYMSTILTAISPFIKGVSHSEQEEYLAIAVGVVYERAHTIGSEANLAGRIQRLVQNALVSYISKRDQIPADLVRSQHHPEIVATLRDEVNGGRELSNLVIEDLSNRFHVAPNAIRAYYDELKERAKTTDSDLSQDPVFEAVSLQETAELIDRMTDPRRIGISDAESDPRLLTKEQAMVLRMFFLLEMSKDGIGGQFGITTNRGVDLRIEAALAKLTTPEYFMLRLLHDPDHPASLERFREVFDRKMLESLVSKLTQVINRLRHQSEEDPEINFTGFSEESPDNR